VDARFNVDQIALRVIVLGKVKSGVSAMIRVPRGRFLVANRPVPLGPRSANLRAISISISDFFGLRLQRRMEIDSERIVIAGRMLVSELVFE
jgi:hypothetical protein